ncbi:hypothetical protein BDR07DRAFT_473685 [Suillus spraguei]|nr:hypothetical protein BDR07DRAFT_473685 [Suillus spraguei]
MITAKNLPFLETRIRQTTSSTKHRHPAISCTDTLSRRATVSCGATLCLDTPSCWTTASRGPACCSDTPGVMFQPLPGPPCHWMPSSQKASGMIMMPPPNLTYPYAIITAFPPSAPFRPSINASTVPPPSTSSLRHCAYSTKKCTKG